MWIKVRTMVGGRESQIDGLSKLTKIEELRKRIQEAMETSKGELEPTNQRLFFKGKELIDEHSLYDYDVGLNDCLQLLVRKPQKPSDDDDDNNNDENQEDNNVENEAAADESRAEETEDVVEEKNVEMATYKTGELVDVLDSTTGAWFEGEIHDVKGIPVAPSGATSSSNSSSSPTPSSSSEAAPSPPSYKDDGYSYVIKFENYADLETVSSTRLRPISRGHVDPRNVKPETIYLVNANLETPEQRGFWYDFFANPKPSEQKKKRVSMAAKKELEGWIFAGSDRVPVETKIVVREAIYKVEHVGDAKRIFRDGRETSPPVPEPRPVGPECEECKGDQKRKCKSCGCSKCGGKGDPDKTIVCDECEDGFHLWCLTPPLEIMPEDDEWFCPGCRNDRSEIVQAGEGLKASKRKANMPSAKGDTKRDWGKGMATQGVAKKCTIVDGNHFGPIPGVHVGTCWLFRLDVAASGVHRPPVAGIAGKASLGAPSIILSGGYEDDDDNGETFTYTGAGGRDLSGNKRTAGQSCDQTLTKTNMALAKSCAAKVNEKGGDAGADWRKGKPLRVVRNYKGAKHSKYAPAQGNRYDGIYKVVRYWPDTGKAGFLVWRYEMRRDDETPAPWTKAGKKMIEEWGIQDMIVPDGYYEKERKKQEEKEQKKQDEKAEKRKSRAASDEDNNNDDDEDDPKGKSEKKDKRRKRKISSSEDEDDDDSSDGDKENAVGQKSAAKRARKSSSSAPSSSAVVAFVPPKAIAESIDADAANAKVWLEVKGEGVHGRPKFVAKLKELFTCVCCQEVVADPVTTPCGHNACQTCLKRSFGSGVKSCPVCRGELNDDDCKKVNDHLASVLKTLLPGYELGR